ncbi:MAG: carbon-nitrogen hydrolase family protein [Phenylobacterium sp.]|uniref:carbon-nitrogen hydrolase family protein n=1 Tax=Phenylobacterium sp. TaxID=1871053 RepID=UPI00391C5DF6
MRTVRIAAAQTPDIRGDVEAALACLSDFHERAKAAGAALLCFPEGFLHGYETDAEAARPWALDLGSPAFAALLARLPARGPMLVFGLAEADGERLFNTAVVVQDRALVGRYRKAHLLGAERGFAPGTEPAVFGVDGLRFGLNICFDTNFPQAARQVADLGASLLVCPANNMLPRAVAETWKDAHNAVRAERCREAGLWALSADVTGERHGRVGWGPTAVIDPAGQVRAQLPLGAPGLLAFDLPAAAPLQIAKA